MKTERNSSFELLRLFCIFGIVVMHAFGGIDTSDSLLNTELHVLSNSVFNTGVTCFILISGYFGIRFDFQKLVRMDMMVIFFTLAGAVAVGGFGVKDLIKACIPVLSRRYWFITCYFALCILAPFLNQIPQHIEKAKFRSLLLALLLIFSFIPTFIPYDIMQDAGKGLADFVMIYLLGRYLALYKPGPFAKKNLLCGFFLCILVIFVSDSARTLHSGVLYNAFSRDCSVFIILASVLLLLYVRETRIVNRAINRIAANVLAVTVLDSWLQHLFRRYFNPGDYGDSPLLFPVVLLFSLLVVAAAVLLNELRSLTVGRIEPFCSSLLETLWQKGQGAFLALMQRVLAAFLKPQS